MKHTASKLFRALCGMDTMRTFTVCIVVMLALVAGITSVPALAASNGIYIATATPHYKHPTTGVIEDSGGDGSAVLGQSMTESATYKQALVEVDPQGNTYITIRLQLMDNIQNPQFQVDGKAVTATLMQENYGSKSVDNTADYRMKVNSENSVIRCNMYVIAMGREVIFYITVSNLQSGSGDFVTSVKVEEPKQEETTPPTQETQKPTETQKPAETQTPAETQKPTETPSTSAPATEPSASTEPSEETTEPVTSEPATEPTETTKPTDSEPTEDSKNTAAGLQEFDASGNAVTNETESDAEPTNGGSSVVLLVVGGVIAAAIIGGCIWYFGFFKKK